LPVMPSGRGANSSCAARMTCDAFHGWPAHR
jgi:hypothetical protein